MSEPATIRGVIDWQCIHYHAVGEQLFRCDAAFGHSGSHRCSLPGDAELTWDDVEAHRMRGLREELNH